MKNYKLYTLVLVLAIITSCSKDEDCTQPTSQQQQSVDVERITYNAQVAPLLRKACSASNCHSGVESNSFSSDLIYSMLSDGNFQDRVFAMEHGTACGSIDNNTLSVLKSWIAQGSPME